MKYEHLTFIRNRLGMSQRSLANHLKVSKSTYARWETGEKIIPLYHLIDLCNFANISCDYALGLTDNKHSLKNKICLNNKKNWAKIKTNKKKKQLNSKRIC